MQQIECSLMKKNNTSKTIITVGSGLRDVYYPEWQKLIQEGFSHLINTSVTIPEEVYEQLNTGVYIVDGDIIATDYISQNTDFEWVHERMKFGAEAIGNGNLPGSIGKFVKKPSLG